MKSAFELLFLLVLCVPAFAAIYSLTDSVNGTGFYEFFDFEDFPDPTHGRVNYVDGKTAKSKGLVDVPNPSSFVLRADSSTVLDPNGQGRDSVRIISKKAYTHHVAVFDIHHMPEGCGTWPAVWTVGADWPNGGEIDIVEGVNNQSPNHATVHTSEGCTMPPLRLQTGNTTFMDCNVAAHSNAGCGVTFPTANSFGPSFNSNGGGWFALERSPSVINIYFWSRNSSSVPVDVKHGASWVRPSTWGTPVASFPNTSCDLDAFFKANNIVINLTFCGEWAGAVYDQSGCPSNCIDFVNNNPSAFKDAFFDFESIRIYQPDDSENTCPEAANPSAQANASVTATVEKSRETDHASSHHHHHKTHLRRTHRQKLSSNNKAGKIQD